MRPADTSRAGMPTGTAEAPSSAAGDAHTALKTAISSGGLRQHRSAPVSVVVTTTPAELEQAATAAVDPASDTAAGADRAGPGQVPMSDLIRLAAESIHYLAVFDNHPHDRSHRTQPTPGDRGPAHHLPRTRPHAPAGLWFW